MEREGGFHTRTQELIHENGCLVVWSGLTRGHPTGYCYYTEASTD